MVNKNVAQKAVVAALSGMMALAPAAPAFAAKIDLSWDIFRVRTLVKDSEGNWKRLAGDDRYETNVVANDYAYSTKIELTKSNGKTTDYYAYDLVKTAIVVSGENFADALAASGLSGAESVVDNDADVASYDGNIFWWKKSDGNSSDAMVLSRGLGTSIDFTKWYDNSTTYKLPAPIILTKKDKLSSTAKDLLDDLAVQKVIVLGGTASVSDDVINQIKDMGIDVDRVAGANRVETANEALRYLASRYTTLKGIVVCTSKTFADALSIAPVAIREGYGLVFTEADGTLSQSTVDAIKAIDNASWNKKKIIIVGGDASVSNTVVGQLADTGMSVERIDGANRYLTSVKIAKKYFGVKWNINTDFANAIADYDATGKLLGFFLSDGSYVAAQYNGNTLVGFLVNGQLVEHAYDEQQYAYSDGFIWNDTVFEWAETGTAWFLDGAVVADGENYPDALTAGPIAAMFDEPIVLVGGNSTAGIKFLKQSLGVYQENQVQLGNKNNNLIVGGEASVSKSTKDKLEDIKDFDINKYFNNDWSWLA